MLTMTIQGIAKLEYERSTACGGDPTFHTLSNETSLILYGSFGLLSKGSVDRTTLLELIAQLGTQLRCSFNPQVSVS